MSELRKVLKARFKQSDLKKLYGAANLTTINAYAVIERLNDAFGIGGWRIEFEIVDQSIEEVVVFGRMYIVIDGTEIKLSDTAGNMENRKKKAGGWVHCLGDLIKGAGTNLIGKSASFIEIGLDIYKGLQDHNTPDDPIEKIYDLYDDKFNELFDFIEHVDKNGIATITKDNKSIKSQLTQSQLSNIE